ncbi:MAG: U32 family peptidase [Lysobacter sp.]|nr:U32 family peptidase [Lysobacter sp.]
MSLLPDAHAAPAPHPAPGVPQPRLQLTVAAATLDDVRLAVSAGADWVNFTQRSLSYDRRLREISPWMRECEQAIALARQSGRRIAIAFAARYGTPELPRVARAAVALADAGVDALIASDLGTLDLIRSELPRLALHVSPQASATNREAVCLYATEFGASRVAIPTSLPLERLRHLVASSPAELELFGHGSHGTMLEGQCALSSWITGASVGRDGACSPARMIHEHRTWRTVVSRLNGVLIDVRPLDANGRLTAACRGRFRVSRGTAYLFGTQRPENLMDILPTLASPRVIAFRVVPTPGEPGRQLALLRAWREAIDACLDEPARYAVLPEWRRAIAEDGDLLPCSASTTGHL